MTLDADLAAWGEPAADPPEQLLAEFLDDALDLLARGEAVDTARLLPGGDLAARGQRLLAGLRQLCGAAASVWENSGVLALAPPRPSAPDPFPGEFRVERRLGAGAFGEVWLAEDLHLGRPVALKFLRVAKGRDPAQALAVLRNDARLLASVNHPNLLPVYAWRQAEAPEGPTACLVLRYSAGGSLEGRVRREGRLPWHLAARYVADAADGLAAAHARGIVHRDVKPANLLWDPERDEVLLADFGIAARLSDPSSPAGTPSFMAPEAFDGRLSPAVDVYALAATLFRLVAGEVPFPADSLTELRRLARAGLPEPDPRCAGLPGALERLVRAGLAARPEDRPTLADFGAALRGSLNLLLADTLLLAAPGPVSAAPVNLRLLVSRQVDQDTFVPVAATAAPAEGVLRDMRQVPPAPGSVRLRTGDRVRLEVVADRPGHVSVFNVGPTGNLNLLYPAEGASPPLLPAHRTLHVQDVQLTPPQGRERLFALWTREPLPLRLDELLSLAEQGTVPGSGPARATRDMVRVKASLGTLRPEDRAAVVLELDHL
jgi:serine/threonine protein kinase